MEKATSRSAPVRPWIRRVLLVVVAILLIPAGAGFLHENISEVRDRRFHPMPGQLVDVGGRKMHIYSTGDGSPTVMSDSGLGDSYLFLERSAAADRAADPEIAQAFVLVHPWIA